MASSMGDPVGSDDRAAPDQWDGSWSPDSWRKAQARLEASLTGEFFTDVFGLVFCGACGQQGHTSTGDKTWTGTKLCDTAKETPESPAICVAYDQRLRSMSIEVGDIVAELRKEMGERLLAGGSQLHLGAGVLCVLEGVQEGLRGAVHLLRNGVDGLAREMED